MAHWFYCQFCMQWNKAAAPVADNNFCPVCNNLFVTIKPYADLTPDNVNEKQLELQKSIECLLDKQEKRKPPQMVSKDEVSMTLQSPEPTTSLKIEVITEKSDVFDSQEIPEIDEVLEKAAVLGTSGDEDNQASLEAPATEIEESSEVLESFEDQELSDAPEAVEAPETFEMPRVQITFDVQEEKEILVVSETNEIPEATGEESITETLESAEAAEILGTEEETDDISETPEAEGGEELVMIETTEDLNDQQLLEAPATEIEESLEMLEPFEDQELTDISVTVEAPDTFKMPGIKITFDQEEGKDTLVVFETNEIPEATSDESSPETFESAEATAISETEEETGDISEMPEADEAPEASETSEQISVVEKTESKEVFNRSEVRTIDKTQKMTRKHETFIERQRRLNKLR